MKSPALCLLTLTLIGTAFAEAQHWSLEPCPQTGPAAEGRAEYAAAVRSAAPGTPLYIPHPFPKTPAQIFEDLVAFHTMVFEDTPADKLRPEEARLFTALAENRIRYEVVKVENWTPLRCGRRKERRTWSLLRLFDLESNEELARATVDEVGHVGRLAHRLVEHDLPPILDLGTAQMALREVAPDARDAQYVATWGTLECDELNPCVAMRDGSRVYLLDGRSGRLFSFDDGSRRFSFRKDLSVTHRDATYREVARAGGRLVSLGHDSYVQVEPVANASERP